MSLPKQYDPKQIEPRLQAKWEEAGVHYFQTQSDGPVSSIDTPPATGDNVFYPMGYDDNGLPTERLVERLLGTTASEIGRPAFIEKCLQLSQQAELEYQQACNLGIKQSCKDYHRIAK